MVSALALAALVAPACVVRMGQHVNQMEATYRAAGAPTIVFAGGRSVDGELVEVRDSAFVVLTPTELVLAPFGFVDSAQFNDRGRAITRYRNLSAQDRDALRLISRYPPGMPDVAVGQLLASRRQAAIRNLAP